MADNAAVLREWYRVHSRDLPWRKTKDPYKVWISEVILQQTRVIQGTPYYHRFLKTFPDVKSLASATVEKVLGVWEGLGYYRRALHLHEAARQVVEQHGGKFPVHYKDLIRLKGIGDYTAAAIASLCGGEAVPAIDGNVRRFLCRLYQLSLNPASASDNQYLKKIAVGFLQHHDPGTLNQALIEFGALQCTPGLPDCQMCPFQAECLACQNGVVELLPVRPGRIKPKTRYFTYILYVWRENGIPFVLIRQRATKDIWAKMYDFPLIESTEGFTSAEYGTKPDSGIPEPEPATVRQWMSETYIHQLTHQRIEARFLMKQLSAAPALVPQGCFKINLMEFRGLAKPRLISRFLDNAGWDLR
ncbi:MAG TPA: A/G-specific adenine glycosylase [Bacteroidales bacterium]|nr:A/G-specific adenine glycosylase [Bacteroidales bacterium]HRZ48309.1 A/G-specific adenine glycosylase [Bacteroidales bacterium]